MLLAYGVFMTFVTAWGSALLTPAPVLVAWTSPGTSATEVEVVSRRPSVGFAQHMARRGRGIGLPARLPGSAVLPGEPELVSPKVNAAVWVGGMTTVDEVRTYVYGLPFPSLRWWSDFPPPTGMARGPLWTPDQPIDRHGGLLIAEGTRTSDAKMLPLSVCWGPFAANVAFWLMMMVIGVEANAAVARWRAERRMRLRGACPHCGYDREGLGAGVVCPECGKSGRVA